ncbi:MAG: NAD(P)/FAD-dependent oxidoreductase [Thermodesulfobacteriota bacterium]|nr:NAD(P)/FAD-dependent oxidoreductase [Thermodesulfobacteriota bacterium]
MSNEYDLVFIGSGHNALVCGAYLAKCGMKVGVFERLPFIGGGVTTVDGEGVEVPGQKEKVGKLLPGFKVNLHSMLHEWIHTGPVYKDLELEKYGARYAFQEKLMAMVYSDGSSIIHWKDLDRMEKEIERFSKKDAVEYKNFVKEYTDSINLLVASLFSPPIPDSVMSSLLEDTHMGRELLRIFKSSPRILIEERFESEALKTLMAVESTSALIADDRDGIGVLFAMLYPLLHKGGLGLCIGGSINLSKAIARIIEEKGGNVFTNSPVRRIIVENGIAKGIELEDGKKILAKKAVITNLNPKLTFLDQIGEENLDKDFIKQIKRLKADPISFIYPYLALNEPPKWKAEDKNPEVANTLCVGFGTDTVRDVQKLYNDIRIGLPSKQIGGQSVYPTVADPTQAPPGKHTALHWQWACYNLHDGGPEKWDEIKEEYGDYIVEQWRKFAPNFTPDNILARYIHTAIDCERVNPSMMEGAISALDMAGGQMFTMRPFHGYPPYRTPFENLYMCGPSCHPGGGCSGAPGYNAAGVIAEDLKLKKWWTPISIVPK